MTLSSHQNDTRTWSITSIIILTTLEVSFMLQESSIMLLENIYSKGITREDHHNFIEQATDLTHILDPAGKASQGHMLWAIWSFSSRLQRKV